MPGPTRSAKSISPPEMYAGNLKLPVNAERAYVEEGEGPVTLGLG